MTNIPVFREQLEYLIADPPVVELDAVTGLEPENLQDLMDLKVQEKPTVGFTLSSFAIRFLLSPVYLAGLTTFRARAFVWVKGTGAQFAPVSHWPAKPLPAKSSLWRLGPDVHGGDALFTVGDTPYSLSVDLPSSLKVYKLQVVPYNTFSPYGEPEEDEGPGGAS